MITALAACLLFIASASWIEANEKRAALASVKALPHFRYIARAGGWLFAILALIMLAQPQGWERGIPIWFGWLSLTSFISLMTTALFPGRHLIIGYAASAFLFAAVLTNFIAP